ncbi:MAG: sulfatase-like hydrolase/transferase [Thermodesulfobacteriota bacterium]
MRTYRRFYIVLAAFSLNIFTAFSNFTIVHIKQYSYGGFILYGIFFILSFPLRLVPGLLFLGAGLSYTLWWINEEKSGLTQLPLTVLDFRITMSNPEGVVEAIKAPVWTLYIVAAAAVIIVLVTVWAAVSTLRSIISGKSKGIYRKLIPNLLAVALLIVSANIFLSQFLNVVRELVHEDHYMWESVRFSGLSRKIGIWGFLFYSYHLERIDSGDFLGPRKGAPPPTNDEIAEAVHEYINIGGLQQHKKPNIVVVLAESTFNPEDAFKLSKPVHNKLFEPTKYTQAVGPMLVNAVGGGTWITEFEFVTGIDSRLFGYSGFYTHSSLSPYVKESFATYLKKHGYVTEAYYVADGDFYNGSNAYKNYGFDSFRGNIGPAGWGTTDEQVADIVISLSKPEEAPFLKVIITIENHSPHVCKNFSSKEKLVTTFEGSDEFNEANCALNEFIRHTRSTERGFLKLIKYLEDQEKLTGRPFVLLIYGDHQPYTFAKYARIMESEEVMQYQKFRSKLTDRETFFHIVSSIPGVLKCCGGTVPHITMMPTLLSAYVASGIGDLYMGVNLYNFRHCGSDFMNNQISNGAYGIQAQDESESGKCAVYDKLLTAYRNSGVF